MKDKGWGRNLETYVICSLMAGIFILDLNTQLGVAAGMLYVVPIFIMTRLNNDRQTILLGIVAIALTIAVAFFKPVSFSGALDLVGPNRAMMVVSISIASALAVVTIRKTNQLEGMESVLQNNVEERTFELSRTIDRLKEEEKEVARAESSLREIENRSLIVFQSLRDAMGVSLMGKHLFVNPAYMRLFGYDDTDDLMRHDIFDLIALSKRSDINDKIKKRARGDQVESFYETTGLRKDGTEFDMEVKVSSLEWEGEKASLVIMRDISERKKAEAELLRSKEELEDRVMQRTKQLFEEKEMLSTTLRSIGDAVIATDIDENITVMNRVA